MRKDRLPSFSSATTEETHQIIRDNIHFSPLYAGAVRKMKELEGMKIPADFDYVAVPCLSDELKAKLALVGPAMVGHAERIPLFRSSSTGGI